MHLFARYAQEVRAAVARLQEQGVLPAELPVGALGVEAPRDPAHGDLATNAALALAKPARMNPRAIGEALAGELASAPHVEAAEVAGPGFVNLRLSAAVWREELKAILATGADYGRSGLGAGARVNVEYVSANPTGPLHVGHCRGAVFGDALASLLAYAGFDVVKEYYVNDGGAQVDALARSAHLRYREALGHEIGAIPEGLYPGDYLKPVGAALAEEFGPRFAEAEEAEWLDAFRARAVAAMMDMIRADLAALGVTGQDFHSERAIAEDGRLDEAVGLLAAKGLIYEGVLEPPKGKAPEDWEPRPQTLFRATQYGDDTDRPLKKSDGSWTYFAPDIAYHFDKWRRGSRVMIDVLGADHGGYVKRMKAVVAALTGGEAVFVAKLCQMVKLSRGGEPVKMSKRAGQFVTLAEVVEEAGKDVVRFIMLTRTNDAMLEFDFEKVKEQSRDNPVFYVQYAHARAWSLTRRAEAAFPGADFSTQALARADYSALEDPAALALIARLAEFPRLIEAAAAAHEPHRVAFYLGDLAAAVHGLWTKGKGGEGLRFVVPGDLRATMAGVGLIRGAAEVVAAGLGVLGVEPVKEM